MNHFYSDESEKIFQNLVVSAKQILTATQCPKVASEGVLLLHVCSKCESKFTLRKDTTTLAQKTLKKV